jgi:isoquinoline 1-oxidoreductase alpha subunit
MVDIDGRAVMSCQIAIKGVEGSFVTTLEGLSRDRSHPVQQALVAEGAIMCGFCTPGIVMAAAALLKANPKPSDADIDAAITNLCRCGTYPRVRRAIHRAGRVLLGLEKIAAAPPPGISPEDAARTVPALEGKE